MAKTQGQMTKAEAGALGGKRTKAAYGLEFCPTCDQPIYNRHFREIGARGGRKGGLTTLQRYGREHMTCVGRMGGRGNKRHGDKDAPNW